MLSKRFAPQGNGVPIKRDIHQYLKYSPYEGFAFCNDVWDLNFRSNVASTSLGRISFAALPPAVKNEVKAFVVHGIQEAGLSNNWLQITVRALKKAFLFLEQQYGSNLSPLQLTRQDAAAVEEHFRQMSIQLVREEITRVAEFAAFLRSHFEGQPADFRPNPRFVPSRRKNKRSFSDGLEQVIPDEVSSDLMQAVGWHQLYLTEQDKKSKSQYLKSGHLYLAILVLLLFSGRRVSEILFLKRDCLREPTSDEVVEIGQEGIWLMYQNTKARLGQKRVFVTEPGADLVRNMVEHVRVLTEPLALATGIDKLFLANTGKGPQAGIRKDSRSGFNTWLNGRSPENGEVLKGGFVHWYNIKYQGEYYYLNPHQTRHTLSHKAYLGGASYVDVGDYLHHKRTIDGLSPMTSVYLHGQKKDVQLIQEMNARRVVTGKAAPLISNRLVVLHNLDPSDATIWREQGMVLHPTHYGH